jgi:hypothetical protein
MCHFQIQRNPEIEEEYTQTPNMSIDGSVLFLQLRHLNFFEG